VDWVINAKNTAYASYSSQGNNSLNDQSTARRPDQRQFHHEPDDRGERDTELAAFQYIGEPIHRGLPVLEQSDRQQYQRAAGDLSGRLVRHQHQRSAAVLQKKWQFRDDLSKTIGKHTLKGGVDFIDNPSEGGFFEFSSTLEIDFAADPSVILNDAKDYPQKFATPGAVTAMTQANGNPYFLVSTKQLGFYFQDDWKVSSRLTLNLACDGTRIST